MNFLYLFVFILFFQSAQLLACTTQGNASLRLTVEPVELAVPDRVLEVALYNNDCIVVRLPSFHRRAGDYSVIATSNEIAHLEKIKQSDVMRNFSNQQLKEDIALFNRQQKSAATPELFEVADGAVYTLYVQNGDATSTVSVHAIFQYAERYPEIASLQEFKQAVSLLLNFSQRDDLQLLQENTTTGAQP